ncbi:MAG: ABC transporter ATP-binding protein [Alphaproteobacteria bacterium]|nr:ABC transporter ATP-binding protein [Alphaproteobacteria bacterium]MDE1967828.1 ABC transporter ATP-binding protein [Alphaproteobacteria bacterium]
MDQAVRSIRVEALAHHYGRARPVLDDVSFVVGKGEIVAVVGRSGGGKSTLLQLIAGFARPSTGRIFVAEKPVVAPSPACVLMFQEPSLYPWMSVAQNIAIGLDFAGRGRQAQGRVAELLKLVQLEEWADTNVQKLSGGQQQRVAFARSLAPEPEVLLLDEPFSGLDPLTRVALQYEVREIARRIGLTVVIVSHDFDEAITLADRVLVLAGRPGRIVGQVAVTIEGTRKRETMEFRRIRAQLADLFHTADQGVAALAAAG